MKTRPLAAVLLLLASCDTAPAPVPEAVRDSAGIRVVEYGAALSDMQRPLRMSRIYRVGWRDGDPMFEGADWPAPGQLRMDGSSVVGDYGAQLLYEVDPTGEQVQQLGRQGEGPGEYRWLDAVVLEGDTIVLQDDGNRRLTWFLPDGSVATASTASIGDEVILSTHPSGYVAAPQSYSRGSEVGWLDVDVVVLRRTGEPGDTLATLPMKQVLPRDDENPLSLYGTIAGFPGGDLAYARNDTPEVRWYGPDGRLRQVARWADRNVTATDDDWERYEEWYGSQDFRELDAASLERTLREAREDFGGTMPVLGQIHGSEDGAVWVGDYSFGGMPSFFDILDASGGYLGRVDLPDRFAPIDVNGPWLLGWEFDRWDVAALSLYRVGLPGESAP